MMKLVHNLDKDITFHLGSLVGVVMNSEIPFLVKDSTKYSWALRGANGLNLDLRTISVHNEI